MGYIAWGEHPAYARVAGRIVPGHFYYKRLTPDEAAGTDSGPELDNA